MSPRARRQAGFTLLEVLVATALTGVVVNLAWQISSTANRVWRRQQDTAVASRAAWSCVHRISRDIRMALPPSAMPTSAAFEGGDQDATLYDIMPEGKERDRMADDLRPLAVQEDRFTFPSASFDRRGRPGMVRYTLRRGGAGGAFGLLRESAPFGSKLTNPQMHVGKVVSLDLKYLDDMGQWLPKWDSPRKAPRAVRVTVGAVLMRGRERPLIKRFATTVYLPTRERIPR